MRKPNLRKTLVLFSVYIVLTLSMAQMVMADGYCRELDIAPGASDGDALLEYCSYPVEFKAMGKWGYFVYGYVPEGKEIELDIEEGPQLELENIQDPPAASHTTGSDEITVFESGAFLLFTSTSTEELTLSTEDDDVYVSGTEECKILMQEKFITEQLIQLEAENEAGPTKMKLNIIADMLGLMGIYAMAITGAPPGGGGNSCDAGTPGGGGGSGCEGGGEAPPGGGGSGCDGGKAPSGGGGSGCDAGTPPKISGGGTGCDLGETGSGDAGDGGGDSEGNPCTVGGSTKEYPSFEILEELAVTAKPGQIEEKWRIKIKEGELTGEEFILTRTEKYVGEILKVVVRLDTEAPVLIGQAVSEFKGTTAELSTLTINDDSHKGKGLARVLEEASISTLLEKGATKLKVLQVMGIGANPYVAKSLKNMKFGPVPNMEALLESSPLTEPPVTEAAIIKSKYGNFYYVMFYFEEGIDNYRYLFLEDESGNFIEGEDYYKENLVGKTKEEVREFLLDKERKGRTIWGLVSYEAKDIGFLKENILDKIVWVGGKCPGKLGYYPAGGGDVSVFKLTNVDKVVIVDPFEGFSSPGAVEGPVTGIAANYDMQIKNLESVVLESDKFQITFEYLNEKTGNWEPKEIIFYNRDANTFFPPELKSGYDVYFERWFVDYYDMNPATKTEVISNLKKDGIYLVAGRNDKINPGTNPEPAPSTIGLKEITPEYMLQDHYQGEIPFQQCIKAEELPTDLLMSIFENKIPFWAEEAYEARAGKASSTVSANLGNFEFRLNKIEEGMEVIKTKYPDQLESLIIKLDDYLIKEFDKSGMNPLLSLTDKETLLKETDQKFCDFASKFGFYGMCGSGGCYRLSKFITDKSAYDMKNSAGETKNFLDMMDEFVKRAKAEQGINTAVFVYGSSNYFFLTSEGKPSYIRISDIDMFISPKEGEMYPDFSSKATAARNELIPKILQENGFVVGGTPDVPEFTLYEGGSPKTVKITAILTLNTHGSEHFIKDTYLREMYYPEYFTAVGDSETIDGINKAFEDYPETTEIREAFRNDMLQKASYLLPADPEKAAKRVALAARAVGTTESHAIADEIIIKFDEGTIDVAYVESKVAQIKGLTSLMGCYKLSRSLTAKEVFNIKNSEGAGYNLLEILDEARVKANSELSTEGTVGIRGSPNYFYESEGSKINWKYMKDIDVIAFDMGDDVPFLKHLHDTFKSRGFNPQYDNPLLPQLFSFEVYVEGAAKRINIDSTGSPPMDWIFADYIKYDPPGMTFLGDSGQIDSLIQELESLQIDAEEKETMRDMRVERAKDLVSDYADYERAYKRLVEAVWVLDNYELRDAMYDEFKTEFEGAKDFKSLYDTWLPKVEALGFGKMCYKLSKSYTTKDAFKIKNAAEVEYNLLEIVYEALKKTGEEGAVAIRGSATTFYESTSKINWKYISDVDMVVIDASPNKFYTELMNSLEGRGFVVHPSGYAVEVMVNGETKMLGLDYLGQSQKYVLDPALIKDYYAEGMTLVADKERLESLQTAIEELKSAERAKARYEILLKSAEDLAYTNDYEKACRRLANAAVVLNDYGVRDGIYAEFVTEFDGAKDFKSLYEKWLPTVKAMSAGKICYKLSKSLTTPDAFKIKNPEGVEFKLSDIISGAIKETKSVVTVADFGTGIGGSPNYFYENSQSINWLHIKDIDLPVIIKSGDTAQILEMFFIKLGDSLYEKGFKTEFFYDIPNPVLRIELAVTGGTKKLNIEMPVVGFDELFDPENIYTNKKYYPHRWTFMGEEGFIEDVKIKLGELPETAEIKTAWVDNLINGEDGAKQHAANGDYEKASKRLAHVFWVMDEYDMRNDVYLKYASGQITEAYYLEMLVKAEGLTVSGLCYKLSKSYTTKDAYAIENTAGQKHNMLDILYEALKVTQETTGQEGAIAIKGSSQYLYESHEKINWKYPADVDMIVIDANEFEVFGKVIEEFEARGFKSIFGGSDGKHEYGIEIKVGEETRILDLSNVGETRDYVFDPTQLKDSYPEDMTFVGDRDQIDDIVSRIEELKSAARSELRHGYLVTEANNWAFANDFEKASKRLIEATWIIEAYELRNEMYAEFKAEFDGAKDFQPFYEKYYPIVDALKPHSRMKIFDSTKKQHKYYSLINDYTDEMSEALKNLDAAKADETTTKLNTLEADIGADTILIEDDRIGLMKDIEDLKERFIKVKEALAVATDLEALGDDAVMAKVKEAKEALMMGRMDLTEDAISLYEKVGQELLEVKEDFDALSEEKKATWAEKIKEQRQALAQKLETFIDFTDNVRTKWHQSKYYKRVYEVMEWPHEKLGKLGKDRLATLGKATGVAMVGIGIVQILAEDVGSKLQVIGDNENNPFYVMVGRKMETIATWIGVGFIAMIAIHILIALVKGGLIAAILSLAMWLVLFVVLAVIITTGLKYFWCDYLNKSLAGDPICMILYGPSPIVMTASIQGTSGTCTMAGTWAGQSEMSCN